MPWPACFRWCVSYHRDLRTWDRGTILCILHPDRLPIHIQEQLQAWSLLLGQICVYSRRDCNGSLLCTYTDTLYRVSRLQR